MGSVCIAFYLSWYCVVYIIMLLSMSANRMYGLKMYLIYSGDDRHYIKKTNDLSMGYLMVGFRDRIAQDKQKSATIL